MGRFEGISAIHCFGRGKRFCTKPMGVDICKLNTQPFLKSTTSRSFENSVAFYV
jgi:hypothetical protein